MNRRGFLRSRQFVQTTAALLHPIAPLGELLLAPDYSLIRFSRRAMATRFEIALPLGTPDALNAAEDALDLIDSLEDQMTVYRDESEVVALNRRAATEWVEVEPGLFRLLEFCAMWTRDTVGAFDIATGALTKAWGFFHRDGRVPTPRERADAMRRTGMRHVMLNPETCSVRFRVSGLEINLGAVGKGYALDRAGDLLREKWHVSSALLSAGGSSVLAMGCPPGESRGWPIGLTHPNLPGQSLGTIRIRDSGLGTSAVTFQQFDYNGRKLGHLLDPRMGWPVEHTASAGVSAPTAAQADALSTALFVIGPSGAVSFANQFPKLGAVLLGEGDGLATVYNLSTSEFSAEPADTLSPNGLNS